jgi:hypothetical protein
MLLIVIPASVIIIVEIRNITKELRKQKQEQTRKAAPKGGGNWAGVASHIIPAKSQLPSLSLSHPTKGSIINNILDLAESHETDGG